MISLIRHTNVDLGLCYVGLMIRLVKNKRNKATQNKVGYFFHSGEEYTIKNTQLISK